MTNRVFVMSALALLFVTSNAPILTVVEERPATEVVVCLPEYEPPRTLDPHLCGDYISSRQCGMAYDCLLQYDFFKRPFALVPCLAAEMPRYDADKLTYTFKLRDDVYFHDDRCFHPDAQGKTFKDEGDALQEKRGAGRKLVAKDLVYSFKRLAGLPNTGGYWVIEGKIAMLDEFRALALKKWGSERASAEQPWYEFLRNCPVEGLSAPDDHTFVVKLTAPYPQLLQAITLTYGAAMPVEAIEYYRNDFKTRAVGTGAFMLKSFANDARITWVKNPKYHEEYFPTSDAAEDASYKPLMGKRLPIADRVEYVIHAESKPQWESFLRGELDASGIDKEQFAQAVAEGFKPAPALAKVGIKLTTSDSATLNYISFNMNDPVVGGQKAKTDAEKTKALAIRRAVALCIDRQNHIDKHLNGRGTPASQLVPGGILGHDEQGALKSQRLDAAEGRKILSGAGFKVQEIEKDRYITKGDDGKQISITVLLRSNDERAKEYSAFLKTCGDAVGIEIKSELLKFSEFLRRQDNGEGQAYDAGWVLDYPDAQNILQLLYGPNSPPGINSASYASAEYDKFYDEMAVLDESIPTQAAKKLDLIRKMNAIIDRDVPWVLMEFGLTLRLHNPWHLPAKPNPFAYSYGKYLWSASAARTKAIEDRKKG